MKWSPGFLFVFLHARAKITHLFPAKSHLPAAQTYIFSSFSLRLSLSPLTSRDWEINQTILKCGMAFWPNIFDRINTFEGIKWIACVCFTCLWFSNGQIVSQSHELVWKWAIPQHTMIKHSWINIIMIGENWDINIQSTKKTQQFSKTIQL